jgi:hypothetical protein
VLLGVVVAADEPPSAAGNPCVALDDWSLAKEPMRPADNHWPAADMGPSAEEPMHASGDHFATVEESVVGCMALVAAIPEV